MQKAASILSSKPAPCVAARSHGCLGWMKPAVIVCLMICFLCFLTFGSIFAKVPVTQPLQLSGIFTSAPHAIIFATSKRQRKQTTSAHPTRTSSEICRHRRKQNVSLWKSFWFTTFATRMRWLTAKTRHLNLTPLHRPGILTSVTSSRRWRSVMVTEPRRCCRSQLTSANLAPSWTSQSLDGNQIKSLKV